MGDIFDERELRMAEYRPDAELTLGPKLLVGIFFGLLVLCGFCFGLGYTLGTRDARTSLAAGLKAGGQGSGPAAGAQPKPSAPVAGSVQPTGSAAAPTRPAPAGAWMVQIAAFSREEETGVLVAALRKRGYVVAVRQDPADKIFHVQAGPFASVNDADATRRRLLNDGYNASVQP
jgi:hypothetical protein